MRICIECNFSLCRKKSIVMKPVSQEFFTLLEGKEYLGLFKWNKKIAEHIFVNYAEFILIIKEEDILTK